MRALRITEPGRFEIVDIEAPPCGPDDVVLRLEAATICNQFDLATFDGRAHGGGTYPMAPGFPGHEGAGEIIEVGANVTDLRVGDHVVTSGIGGDPLYRERVRRRHDSVVRISDRIAWELAAPMELFGCVHRAFSLTGSVAGLRVGVAGLGPAGQAAVALARALGAAEVVGLDIDAPRRALAERMGASATRDARDFEPAHGAVERLIRGQSNVTDEVTGKVADKKTLEQLQQAACDVIVDCSGHPGSLATSFLLARQAVTIFGYTDQPVTVNPAIWFHKELTIRSSKQLTLDDLRAVAAMLDDGRIDPGPMVSAVMPFARYAEALDRIRRRDAIKIALQWN